MLVPLVLLSWNLSWAGAGPRWLRLCDKRTTAVAGTRAWEDAPVREDLLDSLRVRGWTPRRVYRWDNLVSAVPPSSEASLPACVQDAGPVARGQLTPVPAVSPSSALGSGGAARSAGVDEFTAALRWIWDSLGVSAAHEQIQRLGSVPGQGVRIAFMDGAFDRDHRVLEGTAVVDSFDFVDSTPSPWNSSGLDLHGTQTSGLVASSWDELPGIAPGASLLLYRTEDMSSESPAEEDNLAAAIVRACDSGAAVISISLGYRWQDAADRVEMHPWSDFDGRTLVASRAAAAAARRDVVVVVASGNEASLVGDRSIGSPADADSVLVVGAVASDDSRCGFSSFGPTFDGRRKPDVAAYGCSVPVASSRVNGREWGSGTSYATPLVSGMAVLARQLLPGMAAVDLVQAFRSSGSLSSTPSDSLGWGVANLLRIPFLRSVLSRSKGALPLPRSWSLSQGALRFSASAAQSGGWLGVELRTPTGRLLNRWEGAWKSGGVLWNASDFKAPRPGLVVARWWGDYGEGATAMLVTP